jgi:hypothetical protein
MEECDLDSVQARETIKLALACQIDLSAGTSPRSNQMKNRNGVQAWRKDPPQESGHQDHSFNHFVDYRAIGEYESH